MNPKVLLVTGASRGIGAATAILAARRGWTVAVNYRRFSKAVVDVLDRMDQADGRAFGFPADVSKPEAVREMFLAIDELIGPVTALVNCAGVRGPKEAIHSFSTEEISTVISTNLLGTIYCTQEASMRMNRGGAIVNVGSEAARFGGSLIAPYAASKAGVHALTMATARELGPSGIRVNCVSPGVIDTDQHTGLSTDQRAEVAAGIPLRRMGTAQEVAEVILWLLSEEASYVTGAILPVNGGR